MGSYIGIGLVYNFLENGLEKELRKLVNYMICLDGDIRSIRFSKDKDGNRVTNRIIGLESRTNS